jgi:hypothetical protein
MNAPPKYCDDCCIKQCEVKDIKYMEFFNKKIFNKKKNILVIMIYI